MADTTELTVAEQRTIANAIQRLMRAAVPAGDLTANAARLLGEALTSLGKDFPEIADRCPAWLEYTAQVRGVADIKSGAGQGGLWSQSSADHELELRGHLAEKRS